MILYRGALYDHAAQDRILTELESHINHTLAEKTLDAETVIAAIDALGKEIASGAHDALLASLSSDEPRRYKLLAAAMLSRENLEWKLQTELCRTSSCDNIVLSDRQPAIRSRMMPLGVLFHIAAGNMDGLPAYGLAEGLLTGNINILKLPQADSGLSLAVISRLIAIEPALADYITVFDTPSTDIHAMQRMAALADGISVWGGEAAVSAVRSLAPTGAKLIEWGHKLGFCYLANAQALNRITAELTALAEHIAATRQLLCSSCQTIYLNTEDEADLHRFCESFLPLLEAAVLAHRSGTVGERAYLTLMHHTQYLEQLIGAPQSTADEYRKAGCSLTVCRDSELELSPMMCSVLVKRLPREQIVPVLRRKKGLLQTAGLICDPAERDTYATLFARCGVTRITTAGNMSAYFPGEAHDGEYALRRYVRMVDMERLTKSP